jgi:hypothetical protein
MTTKTSNTMYLKLRYRGRLNDPADVQQLTHETEDICRSHGWPYHIWDEDWAKPQSLTMEFTGDALCFEGHAPLKGISFNIGESEAVWLCFQPDGILQSLLTLTDPTFTGDSEDFPWQRVKTCFDGATTHIALCKLFRYLSGRYFEAFEVLDESGYWDHGDDARFTVWIEALIQGHRQLEEEMNALKADETLSSEQHDEAVYRLIKELSERFRPGG